MKPILRTSTEAEQTVQAAETPLARHAEIRHVAAHHSAQAVAYKTAVSAARHRTAVQLRTWA